MGRMSGFGLAPVNAARRELGMAPLGDVFDQFHTLSRSLVLTSREFDFAPSGLPAHVRYVGPQLDDPSWADDWIPPWPGDVSSDPLVAVSLGSTYQRQEKAFAAIVQALGTLPVRGLATFGPIDPPASDGPSNVVVTRSAPHAARVDV